MVVWSLFCILLMQQDSVSGGRISPDVYLMLRRLLQRHQPDDPEGSDLRELLDAAAAATGRYKDDGNAARRSLQEKRADARRCFYHAVNCW